ncbi:MAG: DoxX family protein [Alphaproteobacteria bacterium]|nr:MAG: DoxX family protein [Alphaproteobacteria bacterium]
MRGDVRPGRGDRLRQGELRRGRCLAIAIELGGGLLILCGYHTRAAALLLAGFCVATAVLFHTKFGDRNQLLHFEKDFAIAGGLLVLFAHGGGAWALDALRMPRIRRKEPQARAARVLLMSLVPMSDSRRLRAISRKFGHAADRTFRPPARLIF